MGWSNGGVWMPDDGGWYKNVGAAAADPFALDGTPQGANATTNSLVLPAFSTTHSNTIVYVAVVSNSTPNGVTGGSLTFSSRATQAGGSTVTLYSAVASSPLSSAVFTCTSTGSAFFTGYVFAFSGAHVASPFDPNAAIPATSPSTSPLNITTSNANDILVCALVNNGGTLDANWTTLTGANFLTAGYQIVTTTQTATSAQCSGVNFPCVGDAIIKGP